MLAEIPLHFDRPVWLLLLLLILPAWLISRRGLGGVSRLKATTSFALRVLLLWVIAVALAQPVWEHRGQGLTVTVVLDRSLSVPLPLQEAALEALRRAVDGGDRDADDRLAVVTVASRASIASMPARDSPLDPGLDEPDPTATNLAAGIRLALAILPDDTANRIVLVSDGNETADSVLAAAELARANGVPIDVLQLEYAHEREVLFDRIVAPARARLGQAIGLKLVLRSQHATSGTVYLRRGDETLDLDPDGPGNGMRVALDPGVHVVPVTIGMDQPGPHRFEALFEPDDPGDDMIDRNNRAVGVTSVRGEGRVRVIDDGSGAADHLVRALRDVFIATDRTTPDGITGGLVQLSGYDAVVLADVPRWAFTDEQVGALHAYVHDLGGGLAMTGGPASLGAGGWIDSEVARLLPVKLDPPQRRQMVRGALVLIMHSTEMPQGNYWGVKVAQAAIEALSRLDYAGIMEYDHRNRPGNFNNAAWVYPLQIVGDKRAAMVAAKQMIMGDMPDFGASMTLALEGLTAVSAGQKHVIIISDGDPQPPSMKLLQDYRDARITVSTVMVGGHPSNPIHRSRMQAVAKQTGGNFYQVKNPKKLPQIFIKEAQIVARSLIQEGTTWTPEVAGGLPGPVRGFASVPPITGYVLTAPRESMAMAPVIVATSEGDDPLFAWWHYGLGRSVVFTSDLTGRWAGAWVGWDRFGAFWEQVIRWIMRPSSPANMLVDTRVEGDRAVVEVEALGEDASFLNFLRTRAIVVGPDLEPRVLDLQQVGPGRYRGEFSIKSSGAHLVNIHYTGGSPESPVEGHLQAAVSVPYPKEFRAVTHDAPLLAEVRRRTGGRALGIVNGAVADLWDRSDLAVPMSPWRMWDLLAIIAASLLVLDVAVRRIAIDPEWVPSLLRRATGRPVEMTEGALAAWKRTQRTAPSSHDPQARHDVPGPPADAPGAPAPSARKTSPGISDDVDTVDEGETPDASDMAARLLEARRRARHRASDDAADEEAP